MAHGSDLPDPHRQRFSKPKTGKFKTGKVVHALNSTEHAFHMPNWKLKATSPRNKPIIKSGHRTGLAEHPQKRYSAPGSVYGSQSLNANDMLQSARLHYLHLHNTNMSQTLWCSEMEVLCLKGAVISTRCNVHLTTSNLKWQSTELNQEKICICPKHYRADYNVEVRETKANEQNTAMSRQRLFLHSFKLA